MPVNRAFADAVLDELDRDPDAAVFFHDYHLYLAPRFVRDARPGRALSRTSSTSRGRRPTTGTCCRARSARAIHDGLLANDVVGFHTRRWRRNFMRSARGHRRRGGRLGRATASATRAGASRVTAAPISVDPTEFDELARQRRPCSPPERVLASAGPRSSILRVDRTDPSKNVVRGFRAFELYLDAHPGDAPAASRCSRCSTRRARTSPSTPSTSARSSARRGAVNDRFQQDGWMPIDLQIGDNFPQAVAAYKHFDVLLVNAIFDGLNLVAKEAPLVNERDGVLILSENAGAHEELGDWALTVNPFDVAGQAEAIHARSRCRRRSGASGSRRSGRRCASTTSSAWIDAQLADARPRERT